MNNDSLVIVNVNGQFASVWNFCDSDNALEELEKAQQSAAENVATYERYITEYPKNATYWKNCKAEYENAKFEIMTFGEFLKKQKESFCSGTPTEETEEEWNEALNVLPPLYWCTIDGVEMFCIREMYVGTITNQHARVGGKYYTAKVDVTDKNTWIHNRLENIA